MMRHLLSLKPGTVASILLAMASGVNAQEPKKSPAAVDQSAVKVEKISIKAFRLSLRDPTEVEQTVHGLLGELPGGLGFGGGFVGGGGNTFAGGGNTFNGGVGNLFSGGGNAIGGNFSGLGGGIGVGGGNGLGALGVPGAGLGTGWRTMVDPRTQVLLVRGSEKDLQVVTDLVSVLETPAEKALPQVKNLEVFRLKHADADALAATLNLHQQLRFNDLTNEMFVLDPQVRLTALPSEKLLVAIGPDEALKKLGAVVQELDSPSTPRNQKKLSTRVFRLSACDPEEVKQALESLLTREEKPDSDEFTFRVVADNRTRSLLVRSSESDLQVAADLVAMLETPTGKPLPKGKSLVAFQLKNADADELEPMIKKLDLQIRLVSLPLAKLLVATGPDEDLKSLADVVKDLDVPAREQPKANEQRKLFREK